MWNAADLKVRPRDQRGSITYYPLLSSANIPYGFPSCSTSWPNSLLMLGESSGWWSQALGLCIHVGGPEEGPGSSTLSVSSLWKICLSKRQNKQKIFFKKSDADCLPGCLCSFDVGWLCVPESFNQHSSLGWTETFDVIKF